LPPPKREIALNQSGRMRLLSTCSGWSRRVVYGWWFRSEAESSDYSGASARRWLPTPLDVLPSKGVVFSHAHRVAPKHVPALGAERSQPSGGTLHRGVGTWIGRIRQHTHKNVFRKLTGRRSIFAIGSEPGVSRFLMCMGGSERRYQHVHVQQPTMSRYASSSSRLTTSGVTSTAGFRVGSRGTPCRFLTLPRWAQAHSAPARKSPGQPPCRVWPRALSPFQVHPHRCLK
jgi:hypothetical protein